MSLVEVVLAVAIFAIVFGSVLKGLTQANLRATWIAYDAAASKMAEQRMEQIRNARWDPTTTPAIDEVITNNFSTTAAALDMNGGTGNSIIATSTVQIVPMPNSASPSYKVVRVEVTWSFFSRGPFTNSVLSIRGPDQ